MVTFRKYYNLDLVLALFQMSDFFYYVVEATIYKISLIAIPVAGVFAIIIMMKNFVS